MNRNLAIGVFGCLLIVGTVGAIAAGVDWDPRDVEAAEEYRTRERARAERYRAEVGGQRVATSSEERRSDREARRERRWPWRRDRGDETEREANPDRAEEPTRGEDRRGVDRWLESVGVDVEQLEEWQRTIERWGDWVNDAPAELAPGEQPRGFDEGSGSARETGPESPVEIPAAVDRILEQTVPADELEGVREDTRRAIDWWAEERERLRTRRDAHRH